LKEQNKVLVEELLKLKKLVSNPNWSSHGALSDRGITDMDEDMKLESKTQILQSEETGNKLNEYLESNDKLNKKL